MSKNNSNGFTIKDMLVRIMDNQDKSNEKWSAEMKRLYDAQEDTTKEIMAYNYAQDKIVKELSKDVAKIDTRLGIVWKGLTGAVSLLATGFVALFFKK